MRGAMSRRTPVPAAFATGQASVSRAWRVVAGHAEPAGRVSGAGQVADHAARDGAKGVARRPAARAMGVAGEGPPRDVAAVPG